MNRRIITGVIAAAMLIAIAAPLSESVALAAQKKRACSCKPTLRRKTRSKASAHTANALAVQTVEPTPLSLDPSSRPTHCLRTNTSGSG